MGFLRRLWDRFCSWYTRTREREAKEEQRDAEAEDIQWEQLVAREQRTKSKKDES